MKRILLQLSPTTRQDYMEKIKTDAKVKFYTGIPSVALFNTIFTLIKPYIPHVTYFKGPKHAIRILKSTGRKKIPTSLNPHDEFSFNINAIGAVQLKT